MPNFPNVPNRVMTRDDLRLVRTVYERISAQGVLSPSLEKQDAFAAYLLEMYFRGMVLEDGLYGLGLVAAKVRFGVRPAKSGNATQLRVRKVVIVEDDYLLASDMKLAFEKAGAIVLGPFGREEEALSSLQSEVPDLAVVDLNLGHGPTFALAEYFQEHSVPMCVVSGYRRSDLSAIPSGMEQVPWLIKPTPPETVVDIAATILD